MKCDIYHTQTRLFQPRQTVGTTVGSTRITVPTEPTVPTDAEQLEQGRTRNDVPARLEQLVQLDVFPRAYARTRARCNHTRRRQMTVTHRFYSHDGRMPSGRPTHREGAICGTYRARRFSNRPSCKKCIQIINNPSECMQYRLGIKE